MLTYLPWLPFVALLAPVGVTRPSGDHLAQPQLRLQQLADTGAEHNPPTILLTQSGLASYAAVIKDLKGYNAEHPEQASAAMAHSHVDKILETNMNDLSIDMIDYPSLAQQDTGIAALFKKDNFTPAQFEPTQVAVYRSIQAILMKMTPADSTSVQAKNMALVQAHRGDLSEDWGKLAGVASQNPFSGLFGH